MLLCRTPWALAGGSVGSSPHKQEDWGQGAQGGRAWPAEHGRDGEHGAQSGEWGKKTFQVHRRWEWHKHETHMCWRPWVWLHPLGPSALPGGWGHRKRQWPGHLARPPAVPLTAHRLDSLWFQNRQVLLQPYAHNRHGLWQWLCRRQGSAIGWETGWGGPVLGLAPPSQCAL